MIFTVVRYGQNQHRLIITDTAFTIECILSENEVYDLVDALQRAGFQEE